MKNNFFLVFLFLKTIDYGVVKTSLVKKVMTETDRKYYCPKYPYIDAPQGIGYGATISAPHMVTTYNKSFLFFF